MSTLAPPLAPEPATEVGEAPPSGHDGPPHWGAPAGDPPAGSGPQVGAELLGRYPDYEGAQEVVDRLAGAGFPVEHVTIVGEDLRVFETVTGRVTVARAAATGAVRGLWLGLALGLVLELLGPLTLAGLLIAVVVPTVVSALFAGAAQASLRGRRDFASVERIGAGSYAVLVAAPFAAAARRALLGQWIAAP